MMLITNGGNEADFHKRIYILVRIKSIKEYVDDIKNKACLVYTNTDEMIADILTKPLSGEKFHLFNSYISGNSLNYSSYK